MAYKENLRTKITGTWCTASPHHDVLVLIELDKPKLASSQVAEMHMIVFFEPFHPSGTSLREQPTVCFLPGMG